MNKLEKSVRHCLSAYGAKIRAGGWYGFKGQTGCMPKYGTISRVCADYDDEAGIVTDIRIYVTGDAMMQRDYSGVSVDLTDAFNNERCGLPAYSEHGDWNCLVNDICTIIYAHAAFERLEYE